MKKVSYVVALAGLLLLAGCVLPFPGGDGGAEATVEPSVTGNAQIPPVDGADPNVGGGGGPAEAPPTEETLTEEEPTAVTEPTPDAAPTTEPTTAPTVAPTEEPTIEPTEEPTAVPTEEPTQEPSPTPQPTPQPEPQPEPSANRAHTVVAGDNLYRIGLQYGLRWTDIADANGITDPNQIVIGQQLIIPDEGTTAVPPNPPAPAPPDKITHIVQPGQNLYRISLSYGLSWMEVAAANGIADPDQLYVGQVLVIPTTTPNPGTAVSHVVQTGETLLSIATQYGVPPESIAAANNLDASLTIYVGQTLTIPPN